jgi:hypothetical protein
LSQRELVLSRPKFRKLITNPFKDHSSINKIPTEWKDFAPLTNIQTGGTVKPFIPYDYQIQVSEAIRDHQNVVVGKVRQMGFSETAISICLMRAVTEAGFVAVVFSKTQADASELGRRLRDQALSLGELCPKFASESKTRIVFEGLGSIYFLPITARSARGIPSVSLIIFDEAAFIDGIDGVYQAAMPTLAMLGDKGRVVFISTPNGRSGLFYKMLSQGDRDLVQRIDAIRQPDSEKFIDIWKTKEWVKILIHWRAHPKYGADPDWAIKTKEDRQLTQQAWNVEHELEFSESDSNVFNHTDVDACANGTLEAPRLRARYIMAIDPNSGGDDEFVTQVWDITNFPYKKVAEYAQAQVSGDYSINRSALLFDTYNPSVVAVESNSMGIWAMESFIKYRPSANILGVNTNQSSKRVNTDRLALLIENHQLSYANDEFVVQLKNFRQNEKGQRLAASGFHDDRVMCAAIGFSVLDEAKPRGADLMRRGVL